MKTYLFDFDGTLVDSMPNWSTVMTKILDDYNIDYPANIINIITPLGTANSAEYYVELGVPLTSDEIIGLMGKYMLDEYYYKIPAKQNVIEVLKVLKARGGSLNVLTASPHITLDACLKRLEMWDLFENVWSCDDFNTTKADPKIYRMASEKLGVPPENVLFLDDNANACKTAKEAGMKVCGVYDDTSKDSEEEIKLTSNFYIHNFKELLELSF